MLSEHLSTARKNSSNLALRSLLVHLCKTRIQTPFRMVKKMAQIMSF